jgi:hypothetical protein
MSPLTIILFILLVLVLTMVILFLRSEIKKRKEEKASYLVDPILEAQYQESLKPKNPQVAILETKPFSSVVEVLQPKQQNYPKPISKPKKKKK